MSIPVINIQDLNGGDAKNMMTSRLHEACQKWGFFWVENHGIEEGLLEKVRGLMRQHYEGNMKHEFYSSDLAQGLEINNPKEFSDIDWESTFFVRHQPDSNMNQIPDLKDEFREAMEIYVSQVTKLAENLAEHISKNLELDKEYIKRAFSEPFIGTKFAVYPKCPKPELLLGLRGHTDAGGIILLLQDDLVSGLEFLKDGEWVPITPTKSNRIFVNLGDQIEVLSNGIYKSVWHHVLANKEGSRLSIAAFYNPGCNAIIGPAPKLLYPSGYRYGDYLNYYANTKFADKRPRFQAIKETINSPQIAP